MLLVLGALACFHLAQAGWGMGVLIIGFLYCLLQLTEAETFPGLYWSGLLLGLAIYAPQLAFFWGIFGGVAIAFWLILTLWLLGFLLMAWWWRRRYNRLSLALVAPILWTGLEYFRGELYYLRFSWLSVGCAFSGTAQFSWLGGLGVYGLGFVAMAVAACLYLLPLKPRIITAVAFLLAGIIPWPRHPTPATDAAKILHVAGVQLEFPTVQKTLAALNDLVAKHPEAEVLLLSEYAFDGPVPKQIKEFCRVHQKYLIAGGKAPAPDKNYYDTAFVVGPTGDIVFSQAKCVPVQFFADGLPAFEQRVWYSPWGAIGLGVCYDASYRRVTDELVRQGAQALIFPTMDIIDWGAQEHRLNAVTAPMRAAEYQVPFVRIASSGISAAVNSDGSIQARANFPGQGEVFTAELALAAPGRLPLDHWLAPICTALTAGVFWWLAFTGATKRFARPRK